MRRTVVAHRKRRARSSFQSPTLQHASVTYAGTRFPRATNHVRKREEARRDARRGRAPPDHRRSPAVRPPAGSVCARDFHVLRIRVSSPFFHSLLLPFHVSADASASLSVPMIDASCQSRRPRRGDAGCERGWGRGRMEENARKEHMLSCPCPKAQARPEASSLTKASFKLLLE